MRFRGISGGLNDLFRRINFSILGHGRYAISEKLKWYEEIIVIGLNLVSFLHSFIENISDLTECNVLYDNKHLILI